MSSPQSTSPSARRAAPYQGRHRRVPVAATSRAPRSAARSRVARSAVTVGVAAFVALAALLATLVGALQSAAANPPGPSDPIGGIDAVKVVTTASTSAPGSVLINGWAADPDDPAHDVTAYALLDGHIAARAATSIARPLVSARHHVGRTPGFTMTVPVPAGQHVLCLGVQNVGAGLSALLGCRTLPLGSALTSSQTAAHSPVGGVTSVTTSAWSGGGSALHVTGWAREPDFLARRVTAVLYVDGVSVATVNTQVASAVQRQAGAARLGGINITVPVSSGSHLACVWLVNIGYGANTSPGCSAVDTRGPAGTGAVTTPAVNTAVVAEAKRHIGQPYVWGATGPKSFDCSGLVMYSYGKSHVTTPRVSSAQFGAARLIPASRAVPGDLVFWHDAVGDVYHVSIYLAPGKAVAAIDEAEGVNYQNLWDQSILTYGSFTHS